MKFSKSWAAAAAMVALAGTAQASPMTLVDGGLGVLDSGTNLVWTANMNLNGAMTWDGATKAWIATLNTSNYAGHNDWRMPTLNPSDTSCSAGSGDERYGYNCTGGELSHLFVTQLGNKAGQSVLNQEGDTAEQIANLALFSNVQSNWYWSGTEFAPYPSNAWYFNTSNGFQGGYYQSGGLYAVAVRPGDVASVPEPQTYTLLLAGLGGVVVAVRRRPR